MPPYIQDIADWMRNDRKVHPCNFADAYHGFEIICGLLRSAACGGQVKLPLVEGMDELKALEMKMAAENVIASSRKSEGMYAQ
jgi:hypothetical protein